jgi:hypothetical protein
MATTYSWSYSNTTGATNKVTPKDLKMVTNYAKVIDEPTEARLSNKTASLEQPELVTYQSKRQPKVNTLNKVTHPAPVSSGVWYQTRLDSVLRVTYDNGDIIDEPLVMTLNICHPASDSWTNSRVAEAFSRLIGAVQSADGASWRFEDLMRSALVPTVD